MGYFFNVCFIFLSIDAAFFNEKVNAISANPGTILGTIADMRKKVDKYTTAINNVHKKLYNHINKIDMGVAELESIKQLKAQLENTNVDEPVNRRFVDKNCYTLFECSLLEMDGILRAELPLRVFSRVHAEMTVIDGMSQLVDEFQKRWGNYTAEDLNECDNQSEDAHGLCEGYSTDVEKINAAYPYLEQNYSFDANFFIEPAKSELLKHKVYMDKLIDTTVRRPLTKCLSEYRLYGSYDPANFRTWNLPFFDEIKQCPIIEV